MTDNKIRHAVGAAILLLGLLTYGYSDHPEFNAASWILMAAGTYLITRAFFAIIFTVFTLCVAIYFSGRNTDGIILAMMIVSGLGRRTVLVFITRLITRGYVEGKSFHKRI